jgi:membrane protein CcdC involved in cytochrome C biogenesis
MDENKTVPEMLSGVVKAVFLLCFAALVPLGVAEWYSRHDAPSETREMYNMLESILVGVIFSCIFVWVVAEAWREIKFHKAKSDRQRGEP